MSRIDRAPLVPHAYLNALSISVIAVPFLVYVFAVFRYSANAPLMDDYDVILDFLARYQDARGAYDVFSIVFSQHNEHRIVLNRIFSIFLYEMSGGIDFRHFIYFGNSAWLILSGLVIAYCLRGLALPLYAAIPVPYVLLSFSHWQNMFFPMGAVQNYWYFLLSVLFLYHVSAGRIFSSIFYYASAIFTSGGGLVLFLVGNVFNLVSRRRFLLFFSVSAALLLLFYVGFVASDIGVSLSSWRDISRVVQWAVAFLGNIYPFPREYSWFYIYVGSFLLLASLLVLFRPATPPVLLLVIFYLLIVALIVSVARSATQQVVSRYSIFPLFLLVSLYLTVIYKAEGFPMLRRVVVFFCIGSTVALWGGGVYYGMVVGEFELARTSRLEKLQGFYQHGRLRLDYPDQRRAAEIIFESDRRGIYTRAQFVGGN